MIFVVKECIVLTVIIIFIHDVCCERMKFLNYLNFFMYGIGLITSRLWIGDPKFENSQIPVVIAYKTIEVPFF